MEICLDVKTGLPSNALRIMPVLHFRIFDSRYSPYILFNVLMISTDLSGLNGFSG
ncbi:MAG: hypothetical protein ACK415_12235 [Thermodesulfovibrionales bacterium]